MRKIILLLIISVGVVLNLLSTQLYAQQPFISKKIISNTSTYSIVKTESINCLYDSIVYYTNWDTIINGWVNMSMSKYTYNVNNKVLTELYQYWNGSLWTPLEFYSYTYSSNNLTSILTFNWNVSYWDTASRETFSYTGGKLTNESIQSKTNNTWQNGSQINYTYSGNNLANEVHQNWNSSSWVNTRQLDYTYLGPNIDTCFTQQWNGTSWLKLFKTKYTYTGSSITNYLQWQWNGNIWQMSVYDAYNINTNSSVTFEDYQVWDTDSNDWVSICKKNYDLCNNDVCYTHMLYQTLGLQSIWNNHSAQEYYGCSYTTSVSKIKTAENNLSLFPNPNTGKFTFSSDAKIISIEIKNMLGEKIYSSLANNKTQEINLGEVSKGIYFYNVVCANDVVKVGKFIVE